MWQQSPDSAFLIELRLNFSFGSLTGDQHVNLIHSRSAREPKVSLCNGASGLPVSSYAWGISMLKSRMDAVKSSLIHISQICVGIFLSIVAGCADNSSLSRPTGSTIVPSMAESSSHHSKECNRVSDCAYLIREKVMQNWLLPMDTDENALASVAVSLDDDYKAIAIEIIESNGTQNFDESIKKAKALGYVK